MRRKRDYNFSQMIIFFKFIKRIGNHWKEKKLARDWICEEINLICLPNDRGHGESTSFFPHTEENIKTIKIKIKIQRFSIENIIWFKYGRHYALFSKRDKFRQVG